MSSAILDADVCRDKGWLDSALLSCVKYTRRVPKEGVAKIDLNGPLEHEVVQNVVTNTLMAEVSSDDLGKWAAACYLKHEVILTLFGLMALFGDKCRALVVRLHSQPLVRFMFPDAKSRVVVDLELTKLQTRAWRDEQARQSEQRIKDAVSWLAMIGVFCTLAMLVVRV